MTPQENVTKLAQWWKSDDYYPPTRCYESAIVRTIVMMTEMWQGPLR